MSDDREQTSAFSMDKEQIRKLGYEIVDIITDELGDPSRRPIYPRPYDWDELEPLLGGDAPEAGENPHALLALIHDTFIPASANAEAYLNQLNGRLEHALAGDGRALMTGTELNGQKVMRTCIVNHKASWEGIEATLLLIRELGENLHVEIAVS